MRRFSQSGQAVVLLLASIAVLLVGALVLASFGLALGANGRHQRAADLAAMSAARVMATAYPKLFEPAFLQPGVPNPRHLPELRYRCGARSLGARRTSRSAISQCM